MTGKQLNKMDHNLIVKVKQMHSPTTRPCVKKRANKLQVMVLQVLNMLCRKTSHAMTHKLKSLKMSAFRRPKSAKGMPKLLKQDLRYRNLT